MNSGKTLSLLSLTHSLEENNIKFFVLKSALDTREGETVIHSRAIKEDRPCIPIEPDEDVYEKVKQLILENGIPSYIFVDEAQFLSSKQVEDFTKISDIFDIEIIFFGLRTNFKTQLFEGSKRLFELADEIEEIKSFCKCGKNAIFNARIDKNGTIIKAGKEIEIGAEERYKAVCRKCYFKEEKN